MSYDLSFWKYESGVSLDHQRVYQNLSQGKRLPGIASLPIEQLLARIRVTFSEGWTQLDERTWESDKGAFQLFSTDQFLRVSCYQLAGEDMNRFIDIAAEFECSLYDPQVGKRFEG